MKGPVDVENLEIAGVLREYADLLEIKGSNPFRIRAYRTAVRTIDDLTRPLSAMVKDGEDLTKLPGIGKDMASHIREMVETGGFQALEDLDKEVPRTLADLVRLTGVGPKKAASLWKELDVTSVDDLEEALRQEKVARLPGFGAKSAEKITQAIQDFRKHQGRFLLSEADALVKPLVAYLEKCEGVERVEVAGSYRRRQETVGDVDLLILCDLEEGDPILCAESYPGVDRTEVAGPKRGRVLLRSGLPVDMRVVPRESYGAALHYFSGSKEHNVGVRTLGARRGLRINEYGVFRESDGTSEECLGGKEEQEVFEAVGLPWIPPVLREDRGELDVTRREDLPRLLTLGDLRGDLQMHSTWSDGANSIREMVQACRDRGYEYLALTDHSQSVTVAGGLTPERVRAQWEEVEEVRQGMADIHLFRSLEVDILKDGSLDLPDDLLEGLDLVLVSVHTFMNMSKSEMTERVIRAMEHPQVDILAHPTGRILNRRQPFAMDLDAVLQAAARLDVAVELNAHPSRLDLNDRQVRRAKELGVKVAVNTDAHSVQDLDLMTYGVDQAARGWLEPSDVLNALSLGEFKRWTKRREVK